MERFWRVSNANVDMHALFHPPIYHLTGIYPVTPYPASYTTITRQALLPTVLSTMPLVDYFSRKRTPYELCRLEDDGDLGYIEGGVHMIWPPRKSVSRILLEVICDPVPCRFLVEVPCSHGITFRPHDRIILSPRRCQG